MDGILVKGASDANAKIGSLQVGDVLMLKVERNGRSEDVRITAREQPSN
jgi:hypothetical protein